MTKLPPKPSTASAPTFSKDFEYLIRRELDKFDHEQTPSALQRNSILYLTLSILTFSCVLHEHENNR